MIVKQQIDIETALLSHKLFTCMQPKTCSKRDRLINPELQTDDKHFNSNILSLAYRFSIHMKISAYRD